jgi:hypothetical protein
VQSLPLHLTHLLNLAVSDISGWDEFVSYLNEGIHCLIEHLP